MMEALGGAAIAIVILYGGHQVISGARTPGAFFSFITALLLAYQPMKSLANLNASLQEGLAAAQRVFEVLDVEPAIRDMPGARPLRVAGGEMRFENVRFGYHPGDRRARRHLADDAGRQHGRAGRPVGRRQIDDAQPDPALLRRRSAAAIAIDGQDVRAVTLASLRGAIALVAQEVSLFDDTVRANIAYGRFGASQSRDRGGGARRPAPTRFIRELPQGYDTLVGEHGVRLSGGQRQRIAIARAMLKDAPILLLDEATSALDSESERQVQAALRSLMRGRTTIVIAHRLSTVIGADLICVLDRGRIVETGRHAAAAGPQRSLRPPLCRCSSPSSTTAAAAAAAAAGCADVKAPSRWGRHLFRSDGLRRLLCWVIHLLHPLRLRDQPLDASKAADMAAPAAPTRAGPSSSPSGTAGC